jgi:predicted MPP superfamily phosphohydrolase
MGIFRAILPAFVISQLYWAVRAYLFARKYIHTSRVRILTAVGVLACYALLFAYSFGFFGREHTPTYLTVSEALLRAPFAWWVVCSQIAFLVALVLAIPRGIHWLAVRLRRGAHAGKDALVSVERRKFLERTAAAAVAAPFVAGAYGVLYGRLNLDITQPQIRLARLPRAFEGFRIAQLSDIHIGPFMTEKQIRKCVAMANSLKPDLIVLTGDYVTFDSTTAPAVVRALAGLKAPFGVYATLGNHDFWTGVERSLPRRFAQAGVRFLRYERAPIVAHGDELNLIGVDFESLHLFGTGGLKVRRFLERAEPLVAPDRVNILLTHNPDAFDRAAELGIDLSLAGHTHGGQLALEFISPQLAPSRLVTPYVAGRFEKQGAQLYVNRGIGTIGVPMRVGAAPEITIYELVRG